jgi:hypothetical protein
MRLTGGLDSVAWALAALMLGLLLAGGLAGCSRLPFFQDAEEVEVLWKSRNEFVRLEPQDRLNGAPAAANWHPVRIPRARIRAALQSIAVAQSSNAQPMQLFTKDSLDVLGKHLEAGLAKARPDQDVTFVVEQWYPWGLLGTDLPKTITGRVFYSGNWVHLVFGSILRDGTMDRAPSFQDLRRNPYVPGQRHDSALSASAWAGIYRAPGVRRTDWLVFAPQGPVAPGPTVVPDGGPGAPRRY